MSHATVIAIVKDSSDPALINAILDDLMAPYDENSPVPEYDKPCWCVGKRAYLDATQRVNAELGTIDEVRDFYWNVYNDGNRPPWEPFIKERVRRLELYRTIHPAANMPSLICSECSGTGVAKSTYNPDSKWDWWRVGGRWNGCIRGRPRDSEEDHGFNFGGEFETLEENSCLVEDISPTFVSFAVLTPEGAWHETGRLMLFGEVDREKSEQDWLAEYHQILDRYKHKGYRAVQIDYHI